MTYYDITTRDMSLPEVYGREHDGDCINMTPCPPGFYPAGAQQVYLSGGPERALHAYRGYHSLQLCSLHLREHIL